MYNYVSTIDATASSACYETYLLGQKNLLKSFNESDSLNIIQEKKEEIKESLEKEIENNEK